MCFCRNRVEKYRPNSLEDLISHKDIITTSKLLFPGPTYAQLVASKEPLVKY